MTSNSNNSNQYNHNIIGDNPRKSRYNPNLADQLNKEIEARERKQALEEKLKARGKSAETENQKPEPKIITDISNPENYILLEGRTHGSYEYTDTLVSKTRTHFNKNWNESHEALASEGYSMLTIRQFVDFLNLLKSGKAYNGKGDKVDSSELETLFNDITEVRSPWRSEWLDADFKTDSNGIISIHASHVLDSNNALSAKYNKELTDFLTEDKLPGIDMNDWLNNANEFGLPRANVKDGSMHYWTPDKDNNSVARFDAGSGGADFFCSGNPSGGSSNLGVRQCAAAQNAKNSGGSQ